MTLFHGELAVCNESTNSLPAYDPESLFRVAAAAVAKMDVPDGWREDAISAFVLAATEAAARGCLPGIRVYQHRCGVGAVKTFLREEARNAGLSGPGRVGDAHTVSLHELASDGDGEVYELGETIVDPDAEPPDARSLRLERENDVRDALADLPSVEREIMVRVHLEGQSQTAVAEALGLTRQELRTRFAEAERKLRGKLDPWGADAPR